MRISIDWLNDYVDIKNIDLNWLVNKFTITTAEIEEIYNVDNDVIIEIDNKSLTNRPDLWCHYGIAREISAITGRRLKNIDYINEKEINSFSSKEINIEIKDKTKCLRYSSIKIDNIRIDKSPEVISTRLSNCGIRPINIIVDIANYVMLDIGQPLHTFDEKNIDCIRVTSIESPIKFKCLDAIERELPKDTLMIYSSKKPLAVAGIIGGEESAVSEKTTGIILESAVFEGMSVRRTASAIGMRTDASARYEKFLDTSITSTAIGRFLRLLKCYQPDIKVETKLYDNIINPVNSINIAIEHKYIETYLGTDIGKDTILKILKSLNFDAEENENIYEIKIPTYRATKDITCKADIIEEILRLYGYDKIKGIPFKSEIKCAAANAMKDMEYLIKDILVNKFNFNEVHSYSWYDNSWIKKLGYSYEDTLSIINSGVKQFEKLRSNLLPNLLKVIYDNRKNYEEINIFEIGRIFKIDEGLFSQPKYLMAAIYSNKEEEVAYRYIKGICCNLLKTVKNIEAKYIEINDINKEHCLGINYDGKLIGYIYSLPSDMLKVFNSKHNINIIDINLQLLNGIERNIIKYEPVSKYPETYLDFSILTLKEKPYYEIEELVNNFVHELIIKKEYIDTYIGENVHENMKSTTFRLVIGNNNRTLKLEEITNVKELFISHLSQNGLQLR